MLFWSSRRFRRTRETSGGFGDEIDAAPREATGLLLEDRQLKRAGLDYWDQVDTRLWDSFEDLQRSQTSDAHYFFLTNAPIDNTAPPDC
jgi:tRNA(Leu) C34 or U34 (ribose-2'-O)-methylase TrmL